MTNQLTLKQKRFINFYDGNATQSAIKAGYSKKTARSMGQQLLTKIDISEAIKNRLNKKDAEKIASREERQEFWTKIYQDKNVNMNDRLRASELLGKSQADFVDRVEHSGKIDYFLELAKQVEKNRH